MAFNGRGSMPSIDLHNRGGDVNDYDYDDMRWHRGRFYGRYYTYVPLDNTYVIMQIIVTLLILVVGVITYFSTYKSTIIDPIENIKKLFINSQIIAIFLILGFTLIANFLSKSKEKLTKNLILVLILSIATLFVFFGMKLYLDTTYTKFEFEQMYDTQSFTNKAENKSKIDIGLTGVQIKTDKEYFVDECVKLYDIFKVRTYCTCGLHLLLIGLLIYQIFKIIKTEEKKNRLSKDDLILYDEEENIKI